MSQENVEVVRQICEAHTKGDFKAARKLMDRELEFELVEFPEIEWPVDSYEGVLEAVRDYLEAWDELSLVPKEFIDGSDDQVGVILEVHGGRQGGVEIDRHFAEVWTVREETAVAYRLYRGRDQALRSLQPGAQRPEL
jgi:ketosteroid isomerase-like protein